MKSSDPEGRVVALTKAYDDVEAALRPLGRKDLLSPSACVGWSKADLVFHMLLDAERALVALHSPAAGPPDVDSVTYWRAFSASDDGAAAHGRFVRISAAAHSDPHDLVSRWTQTARAARRAAQKADPASLITTQGHILTISDFIATLVVEANVHFLDLTVDYRDKLVPSPEAVDVTTKTLTGLLGCDPPSSWDDLTFILKATGRKELTSDDMADLGATVHRFPLFS
jgi:Mycothiol maleylpyruvate isomerase N-terminal domain